MPSPLRSAATWVFPRIGYVKFVKVGDCAACAAAKGVEVKLMSTERTINRAPALIENPFLIIFMYSFPIK
jgi:hypothetical protein